MNLDDLISKYLDGELLEEDDRLLRRELSDNPLAREEFDEAVIINSALREDAESILPPREFILETEEKILMKILSTYPVPTDTVYQKPKSRVKYFTAAIVAVILFGFIRLGDNFTVAENNSGIGNALNSHKDILDDEMLTHTYIIANEVKYVDSRPGSRKQSNDALIANNNNNNTTEKAHRDVVSDETVMLTDNSDNSGKPDKNNSIDNINVDNSLIATTDDINSEIHDNIEITTPATDLSPIQAELNFSKSVIGLNPQTPAIKPISLMNMMISGSSDINRDITVSSFLGTDLVKENDDKTNRAFNHISQSLAYSFTDDDKLGVEFGYTEYSVTDIIGSGLIATNHAPAINKNGKMKVQTAEGFNSSQGSPVYEREPYEFNHTKQLYWGAAFYERTIINTTDLALNFRLGVGSSSDGALGFGKVYAKYKIFTGFNLTVGTEGRLYMARFSSTDNKDLLMKSVSLIYGFQIVF